MAETRELVERLRKPLGGSPKWEFGKNGGIVHQYDIERAEAAATIERLQAEIAEAKADRATYNAWAAEIKVNVEWLKAEIERKDAAMKEACVWFLLPSNVDLTGSDRVYRLLDDALRAALNNEAPVVDGGIPDSGDV